MTGGPVFERFRGLGTTIAVGVTSPAALHRAVKAVRAEIDECDKACSRFRGDSDLSRLNSGERLKAPSRWFCEALSVAVAAARETDGLVDPTIGRCLIDLGYDRSFDLLDKSSPLVVTGSHVPAWKHVEVDVVRRSVHMPSGIYLDLGATAKALCADRAAASAAALTGAGVLVSLGGDISVRGTAPIGGWRVRATDRSDSRPDLSAPGQTVALHSGGLATSGTATRHWDRAGQELHHIVDPRTSTPAESVWRTVTVAAPTCTLANTASTAAMVLGAGAPSWLSARGRHARLVTPEGAVTRTGDWPVEVTDNQDRLAA